MNHITQLNQLQVFTSADTWRAILSDDALTPLINFLTVLLLALTAYEGFKSMKATSEANELTLLPLLVIKFIGHPMKNRSIMIKNIGNGSAYDIKIGKYVSLIVDIQVVWELTMQIKGVNVLERGEKKVLSSQGFQNGKKSDMGDFLIFHLDPEQEHERESVELFITFKNAKGVKYYSKIKTGKNGLSFTIPPKRLNCWGYTVIKWDSLITQAQLTYFKAIWRFKKPYIAQPSK